MPDPHTARMAQTAEAEAVLAQAAQVQTAEAQAALAQAAQVRTAQAQTAQAQAPQVQAAEAQAAQAQTTQAQAAQAQAAQAQTTQAQTTQAQTTAAKAPAPPDLSTVWLRVFLDVARHGSFTVAARALGWTQSAVSRQISSLEAALGGAPLFDRLPRGVRLTAHGRTLLPHAEDTVARLHAMRRELASLRDLTGGTLRFGAFATADAALVPRAIAAFRARHPGVTLTREEGLTPGLLARLGAGDLDLAIVSSTGGALSGDVGAYELRHLLDEGLYVALPPAHPLAGHTSVRLSQLAGEEWISGSADAEGTLLEEAHRHGFRPRVAHVVAEWTAKQGYVAAGLGVTLVPALAAESVRPDITLVPVCAEDVPPRAVYAATARGRAAPPAVEPFLEALRAPG